MSVSEKNKNRGAHGDSSFMLGGLPSSSENPPTLAVGSVKYRNLVYCKHHSDDRRAYLYEMPLDKEAHPGDRLCVEDRHGSHTVTAYCENWLCSENMTKVLCEANGGYFPPAQVVGEVKTVTVTQDYVNRYDKEDNP